MIADSVGNELSLLSLGSTATLQRCLWCNELPLLSLGSTATLRRCLWCNELTVTGSVDKHSRIFNVLYSDRPHRLISTIFTLTQQLKQTVVEFILKQQSCSIWGPAESLPCKHSLARLHDYWLCSLWSLEGQSGTPLESAVSWLSLQPFYPRQTRAESWFGQMSAYPPWAGWRYCSVQHNNNYHLYYPQPYG